MQRALASKRNALQKRGLIRLDSRLVQQRAVRATVSRRRLPSALLLSAAAAACECISSAGTMLLCSVLLCSAQLRSAVRIFANAEANASVAAKAATASRTQLYAAHHADRTNVCALATRIKSTDRIS